MTFQIQPPHGALVKVKSRVGSPLLSFDHSFDKTLLLGIADRVTFNYNILDPAHTYHSKLKSWSGVLRVSLQALM